MALIDAIPDNPYDPCPCGCGKKWRYVLRDREAEQHCNKFCDNFEKRLTQK
jgi:hypothetical protein